MGTESTDATKSHFEIYRIFDFRLLNDDKTVTL